MIIKHGAFVCGDPGYIARGYMAFIVIVFVHHFMEVRLHKNAFAFLSKPPGKCVCVCTARKHPRVDPLRWNPLQLWREDWN